MSTGQHQHTLNTRTHTYSCSGQKPCRPKSRHVGCDHCTGTRAILGGQVQTARMNSSRQSKVCVATLTLNCTHTRTQLTNHSAPMCCMQRYATRPFGARISSTARSGKSNQSTHICTNLSTPSCKPWRSNCCSQLEFIAPWAAACKLLHTWLRETSMLCTSFARRQCAGFSAAAGMRALCANWAQLCRAVQ